MSRIPRALWSTFALLLGCSLSSLFMLAAFFPSTLASFTSASPHPTPTVNRSLGLDLRVDMAERSGTPGQPVAYSFAVTNLQCRTHTITIAASGGSFSVAFPGSMVVALNSTAHVVGQIVVPSAARDGQSDTTTVKVACASAPEINDTERVVTAATDVQPMLAVGREPTPTMQTGLGVDLRVDTDFKYADRGQTVAYTFVATNRTCKGEAFVVEVNSPWPAANVPGVIYAATGATEPFTVELRVPDAERVNAAVPAVVRVICQTTPSVADALVIVTRITLDGVTPIPVVPTATFPAAFNQYVPLARDAIRPTSTPGDCLTYPNPACSATATAAPEATVLPSAPAVETALPVETTLTP